MRAAQAAACAWFPADTVTRPRARSSGESNITLFSAPRGLNEPVFWRFSHLTYNATPARAPSPLAERSGVRWILPASLSAAARISASAIREQLLKHENPRHE